jgi:hypothetical protein
VGRCGRRFTTSLRASVLGCPGLARRVRPRESQLRAPLTSLSPFVCLGEPVCSAGEGPRPIHAVARESADATPTWNASVDARLGLASSVGSRLCRAPCRRSLDDTLNGATRTVTKSLPAFSCSSRPAGSAPERACFVRLASDPRDRRIGNPLPWRGCSPSRLLRDHHSRGGSGSLAAASSAGLVHGASLEQAR